MIASQYTFGKLHAIKVLTRLQERATSRVNSQSRLGDACMKIDLPPDYVPSELEEFMNPIQMEYFRRQLLNWRTQLIEEAENTLHALQSDSLAQPDWTDRASMETDRALELRTRDRARKLIVKINEALTRVEDGSYGFCEETAQPIGIRRLMARPIATLSIEAQERHERMERSHRDE
jgi:DnaK suppressor protein